MKFVCKNNIGNENVLSIDKLYTGYIRKKNAKEKIVFIDACDDGLPGIFDLDKFEILNTI